MRRVCRCYACYPRWSTSSYRFLPCNLLTAPVLHCACLCFSQKDSYFLQLFWPQCETSLALRRVAQHWIHALCSWRLGGARLDKGYPGKPGPARVGPHRTWSRCICRDLDTAWRDCATLSPGLNSECAIIEKE